MNKELKKELERLGFKSAENGRLSRKTIDENSMSEHYSIIQVGNQDQYLLSFGMSEYFTQDQLITKLKSL